jgi:hypothetical protein
LPFERARARVDEQAVKVHDGLRDRLDHLEWGGRHDVEAGLAVGRRVVERAPLVRYDLPQELEHPDLTLLGACR